MKHIVTDTGFECDIDESLMDDMEVLDLIIESEDDQQNALIYLNRMVKKIMPQETKNALYDHVRDDKGRVPVEKFQKELNSIFEALKNDKKK